MIDVCVCRLAFHIVNSKGQCFHCCPLLLHKFPICKPSTCKLSKTWTYVCISSPVRVVHMSDVHHVCASSTSSCAFVYFLYNTVKSTVVQYVYFNPKMSRWRRQWHPTPVLLPGKSHGRKSLVGCSPWVAKSRAQLNDFTLTFHFHALEKEMATHSSILAWRIPGTGKPDGLPSMGSHRVGHNWRDLAAAAARCLETSIKAVVILLELLPAPTGRPGVLQFMGSQRVGHDWVTELTGWLYFSRYFKI